MLLSIRNYRKGLYSFLDPSNPSETKEYEEPIEQKWLPNDTIDPITKDVLHRNMQEHRNITGIVDFVNRTRQGFSPRGIPLYMFHPLNKSYPPMIVSSKTQYKINQLVSVNIEQWTEKWPRAGIQRLIGPVGNTNDEQAAILQSMAIPPPKIEESAHSEPDTTHHTPFQGFVCHIDPDGCQDVDDILLWNEQDGTIEFGIGIADVSAFLSEDSALDTYAKRLSQTVYMDGKPVYPMLPQTLSEQEASLRSDQRPRPVLTLFFTLQDGKVVKERWEQNMTIIQKTYTYESIYEDKPTAEKVKNYLEIVSGSPIGDDSHHWIEVAMVLYNSRAAKILKNQNVGIFRSQVEGRSQKEWADLAQSTGCKELAFFGYGSGKYVTAKEPDLRHTGMNLDLYCHVSSPLRRYVDLYNQRWLKSILFHTVEPKQTLYVEHMNERNRLLKISDRNLWFVQNLATMTITNVQGFILKQKSDEYKIYVPVWKRTIKGKAGDTSTFTIGQSVQVRAFTDLRVPSLEDRIVCSFTT